MPKVSVIIPVYNVAQYLRECLDSVISQSLTDIEIICIEDCSTDNSLDILLEYTEKDSRIIILQNEKNKGLAYARNRGVEVASGKYIQFVDSDDFILPNALQTLYDTAKKHDLDVLKSEYYQYKNGVYQGESTYPDSIVDQIFAGDELLYRLEINKMSLIETTISCINFIKASFIRDNDIHYYEGIYYEDVLVALQIYAYASRMMCINTLTYAYRLRDGSITSNTASSKHIFSYAAYMNWFVEVLTAKQHSPLFFRAAMSYYCRLTDKRFVNVNNMELDVDTSAWTQDIAETYELLYNFREEYRLIYDNLELLQRSRVFVYSDGKAGEHVLHSLHAYDILVEAVLMDQPVGRRAFWGNRVLGVSDISIGINDVFVLACSAPQKSRMEAELRGRGAKYVFCKDN